MIKYNVAQNVDPTVKNRGDQREFAICAYYGITRVKHDSKAYDVASDVEVGELMISVKASDFSLMSGKMCIGCHTLEEILNRYLANTHSNRVAYITKAYDVYLMNLIEFSRFVRAFGRLDRESSAKGGYLKVRGRSENKQMLDWLEANCAA